MSNCFKIFSASYHLFSAKVAAEAIAIILLVYFIIDLCANDCEGG